MKKITFGVLILTISVLTSSANAQQQQGDFEAQLAGYYVTVVGTDLSFGMGSIQTKLGYYFTDWFEFGLGPTWTITTTSTFDHSDPNTGQPVYKSLTEGDFGTTAFMQFSFLTSSRTVPYFGGQYYKQSFRNDEDNGAVGLSAGIKFFFTKKAAFDVGGNYLFSLNKDTEGGLLLFAFGLSFLF
jgi:hypothetical protein